MTLLLVFEKKFVVLIGFVEMFILFFELYFICFFINSPGYEDPRRDKEGRYVLHSLSPGHLYLHPMAITQQELQISSQIQATKSLIFLFFLDFILLLFSLGFIFPVDISFFLTLLPFFCCVS